MVKLYIHVWKDSQIKLCFWDFKKSNIKWPWKIVTKGNPKHGAMLYGRRRREKYLILYTPSILSIHHFKPRFCHIIVTSVSVIGSCWLLLCHDGDLMSLAWSDWAVAVAAVAEGRQLLGSLVLCSTLVLLPQHWSERQHSRNIVDGLEINSQRSRRIL